MPGRRQAIFARRALLHVDPVRDPPLEVRRQLLTGDPTRKVSKGADNVLDELAQQAAIEALRNSAVVVFCIDISKANWSEDISICELIEPSHTKKQIAAKCGFGAGLIPVATKCDLVSEQVLSNRLAELNELFGPAPKSTPAKCFSSMDNKTEHNKVDFGAGFLVTSAETGAGLDLLRETIDKKILDARYSSILRSRATAKDEKDESFVLIFLTFLKEDYYV